MRPRKFSILISILLIGLILFRLWLPSLVLRYVNQTLNEIPDYEARIGAIELSLWRGAYVIRDLRMIKRGGQDKYPFLVVPKIDLAIEWAALFQGKLVGAIHLTNPTVNLIQASSQKEVQLEAGSGWEEQGKKLFPFKINRLTVENGSLTFRDLQVESASELHLTNLQAELTGITNVEKRGRPLPSHVQVHANVFDSGRLLIEGSAQLMRDPISFDINSSLEGVDLTKLNPYVKHHAGFTFQSGDFALYAALRANEGDLEGYVKPLFDHVKIVSLNNADNPVELVWGAVAAAFFEIFTNHSADRFATVIPLSGKINDPHVNLWVTAWNVIRNAFIKAFRPGLEKSGT